jgi:hypothetical protein
VTEARVPPVGPQYAKIAAMSNLGIERRATESNWLDRSRVEAYGGDRHQP